MLSAYNNPNCQTISNPSVHHDHITTISIKNEQLRQSCDLPLLLWLCTIKLSASTSLPNLARKPLTPLFKHPNNAGNTPQPCILVGLHLISAIWVPTGTHNSTFNCTVYPEGHGHHHHHHPTILVTSCTETPGLLLAARSVESARVRKRQSEATQNDEKWWVSYI